MVPPVLMKPRSKYTVLAILYCVIVLARITFCLKPSESISPNITAYETI